MNRNVRQGKLLTKLQEMSFFKKNILFIAICFVLLAFSTIGYSALNQKLFISGDLALRAVKDIRISDLKLVETLSGGYEQYNSKYTADTITITSALAEDGSATTYQATITNYGTTDMEIASISSNSTTWFADCTIIGLAKGDEISAGTSKTFKITLKRKANIATTDYVAATLVEFKFQEAKIRYLAYNIGGNSIQNGTPTPTSPVEIESVGDKTKNLLNASLWKTSVTNNGITVEYLEDEDCFLLNGTATSTAIIAEKYINIPNVPGTSYVLSAKYVSGSIDRTNGSGNKYAVAYFGNADTINTMNNWYSIHLQNQDVTGSAQVNNKNYITRFWFYVSSGVKFDNYKVKIQLAEGNVATPYEPYGYKVPIKVNGKNLIKYPYSETTKSINGINFVDNGDGTITINGTATANAIFNIEISHTKLWNNVFPNETYTANLINEDNVILEGVTLVINYYQKNSNSYDSWLNTKVNTPNTKVAPSDMVGIRSYILIRSGTTVQNITIKPQLEKGSTATKYEPYVEPITTNIYLKEPLRKVGNYADFMDYASGKIIRNVGIKNLSEIKSLGGWNDKTTHWYGYFSLLDDAKAISELKIMCDKFECKYPKNASKAETYLSNDTASYPTVIYYSVVKTECPEVSSQSELLTWLKNTNANIHYVLATPIEETIDLPEITVSSLYTNYEILTDVGPSNFTYEVEVKN